MFKFTHEIIGGRLAHRIVAKFGSTHIEGDWVSHTQVARLYVDGRDLFAVISQTNTSLTLKVVCEDCDGTCRVGVPKSPYEVMPDCHTCDGEGVVPVTIATSLY